MNVRWTAWAATCLCACGAEPGAVRLLVSAARSPAEITRVTAAVQPAGASGDLARDPGGTFSGTFQVPAGNQTVTVTAWAGAAPVATGSGSAAVVKGQTARVSITAIDATGPAPGPDHSPVVTSLVASATAVAIGDQVALTADGLDADGDPMAWSWSAAPAGCGIFGTPAAPSTTFIAAANGRCDVTATAAARGLAGDRAIPIQVGAPAPSPALVQHLSSNSNEINSGTTDVGGNTGRNDYRFTLPNPVLPGNVLILGVTVARDPQAPISITRIADSSGDTWSATPAVTTGDGSTRPRQAIFVHPVTNAGTHTITVTTSASPSTFQYTISEFSGIDGTVSGTGSSTGTAPTIDAGSFTPTNNDAAGGNLVWAYFTQTGDPFQTHPRNWTPGGSFTLLDADTASRTMQAHASMYWVQASAAPVTPRITLTGGGSQGYEGVAVALEARSVGQRPGPGIHIERILHTTDGAPPTSWVFQVPSRGDLLVFVVNEPDIIRVTGVTDNKGNTYSRYAPAGAPQFWYTTGTATTGQDLVATVTSSGTPVNATALWYDISGADGVDGTVQGSGGQASCTTTCPEATFDDAPVLTPLSVGLTLATCFFGTGPSDGFAGGAPAGAVFDYVWYTGITDASRMDNSDCRAHLYNHDLATQHWNWHLDWQYYARPVTGTTAGSSAIHIKGR